MTAIINACMMRLASCVYICSIGRRQYAFEVYIIYQLIIMTAAAITEVMSIITSE